MSFTLYRGDTGVCLERLRAILYSRLFKIFVDFRYETLSFLFAGTRIQIVRAKIRAQFTAQMQFTTASYFVTILSSFCAVLLILLKLLL